MTDKNKNIPVLIAELREARMATTQADENAIWSVDPAPNPDTDETDYYIGSESGAGVLDDVGKFWREGDAHFIALSHNNLLAVLDELERAKKVASDMSMLEAMWREEIEDMKVGIIEVREAYKRANANEPSDLVMALIADDVILHSVAGYIDGNESRLASLEAELEQVKGERDVYKRGYEGREKAKKMWFERAFQAGKRIQALERELARKVAEFESYGKTLIGDTSDLYDHIGHIVDKYSSDKDAVYDLQTIDDLLAALQAEAAESRGKAVEFAKTICGDDDYTTWKWVGANRLWATITNHRNITEVVEYLLSLGEIEVVETDELYGSWYRWVGAKQGGEGEG